MEQREYSRRIRSDHQQQTLAMMVSLRLPSLLLFLAMRISSVTAQFEGCSVCGPGLEVGNPDTILVFTDQPQVNCGGLEQAGSLGLLDQNLCSILPSFLQALCECGPVSSNGGESAVAPNPSATPSPSRQPPIVGSSPVPAPPACNICREPGQIMSNPNAIMSVPGYLNGLSVPCSHIETRAALGIFDETICASLPDLVDASCDGCVDASAPTTASPTAPDFPSLLDTPTPAPSSQFGNFDNGYGGEEDSNSTIGSYLMYLILGLVSFFGCASLFYLKYKQAQHGSSVEMSAVRTVLDSNLEDETAAQFARDEKIRALVLQALFPEQKEPVAATVDHHTEEDDDNDMSEREPCSICLEPLDEKDSAIFGSSCAHVYHRDCIIQWLSKKVHKNKTQYHDDCPNCRQRMWDPYAFEIVKESIIRQQAQEDPTSILPSDDVAIASGDSPHGEV